MKTAYRAAVTFDDEMRTIVRFVTRACAGQPAPCRVLDVGCGYGRNLRPLHAAGVNVTGVDANAAIVEANVAAGLPCITTQQFADATGDYDVILMSHLIEHFAPADLVPFMDGYLDRLKPGGHLVLATPLLTHYFYDDFDHVKPYYPISIVMVFGGDRAQIRYYARNQLKLEDVWIRRSPIFSAHTRSRYMHSWRARARQAIDFASALAFRASLGLIGQPTGWVGLFRKVNDQNAAPSVSSSTSNGGAQRSGPQG